MKTTVSGRLLMLAAPLALVLSACGDRAADPAPAATPAPQAAAPAKPKPAAAKPPKREYPADYALDAPIAKGDIATRLVLVGEPAYAKDGHIEFLVNVINAGKTALVGAGKAPVTLAVQLDGAAEDADPVYRKRLPLIPERTAGRVRIRVPAADIAGKKVRLELMQGGLSWAGRYKQPILELGPFSACADPAAGFCGADGKPLKTR